MTKHTQEVFAVLRPLHDGVLVRRVEEESVTSSGLVLPDTAKEKSQIGEVLAVGEGLFTKDGSRRCPMRVNVGDRVLLPKYGGVDVKIDGETLVMFKESDVLALCQ